MKADSLYDVLVTHRSLIRPVVPLGAEDGLLLMNFTQNNTGLTEALLNDTTAFAKYIQDKLHKAGARYGIGGWNEHRTIYSRSQLFDTTEEPRRLHLGIDIWGDAGTAVMAPLDAVVHSFAFNDHYGDYGATVILKHCLNDFNFYTLYGHLSLASIQQIQEGDEIRAGETFAAFGPPSENGHWPPHLHFQLILDMKSYKGDYPGVCRYSEKENYLANSPDPAILLPAMYHERMDR